MNVTMNNERFLAGLEARAYVDVLRNYRSLVKTLMAEAEAPAEHVESLRAANGIVGGPLRATMMTEDWCGDSACNTPVLTDLFSRAGVEFRVFRRSEMPDLQAAYEEEGATHIPVVSLWDDGGAERGRWIEAPAAVAARKDAWKAERPEFMRLYNVRETDKEAAKRFGVLYREFVETMAEWYRDGMWFETTREIVDTLKKRR